MERDLLQALHRWKATVHRKPLILKGVRQCGKTWLLKEFGRQAYTSVAYFNFDEQPELEQFFSKSKDVKRLLENLSLVNGHPLVAGTTLIVFDEIQACPAALNSLKYFAENAPEHHVVCAGSLLGIALAQPSAFPVGKVEFLTVHPMTFTEFLRASEPALADYVLQIKEIEPLPDLFFHQLTEKLKQYFIVGGMPEAVLSWVETQDVARVQQILSDLLDSYERDFAKHAAKSEFPKLSLIWHSVPSQLARENKKFLYRAVKEGSRAREYEDALQWLTDADLLTKVHRIEKPGLPLSAYEDLSAFKVYVCDVGLLRRLARLAPSAFAEGDRLFTEFHGALTENYVLQALRPQSDTLPRYWTNGKGTAEVDFVIQRENDIYPVEVKAGANVKSPSLKSYATQFADQTALKIRFSVLNLKLNADTLNLPLFLADQAYRLLGTE